MSLNETASAERIHIGFFGLRNAGKSSVVNAVTGQELSVVSPVKGTTTDPVKKNMELLPLGPVVIIDTPGLDDEGELGALRVQKAKQILAQIHVAVLVIDAQRGKTALDEEVLSLLAARKIPCITAYNKTDLVDALPPMGTHEIAISAKTGENVRELKEMLASLAKPEANAKRVIGDLLSPDDTVVLVTPIDASAPKGRLILPQQQTIRDILDGHGTVLICQPQELEKTLSLLKTPPALVVTDSQAFGPVSKIVPPSIPLTSFSILFARYKGDLAELVKGASALSRLKDGDRVLISEGCTHHRQCNDIGTVKIPGWILNFTGKKIEFSFTSGGEFPEDLSPYAAVIHCGGCMLNEKEMAHRIRRAVEQNVPIVNYGIAIAHVNGILARSLEPFPAIRSLL